MQGAEDTRQVGCVSGRGGWAEEETKRNVGESMWETVSGRSGHWDGGRIGLTVGRGRVVRRDDTLRPAKLVGWGRLNILDSLLKPGPAKWVHPQGWAAAGQTAGDWGQMGRMGRYVSAVSRCSRLAELSPTVVSCARLWFYRPARAHAFLHHIFPPAGSDLPLRRHGPRDGLPV